MASYHSSTNHLSVDILGWVFIDVAGSTPTVRDFDSHDERGR